MKVLTQEEFDKAALENLRKVLEVPLRFKNYIVKDIIIDAKFHWKGISFINCRIENLKLNMSRITLEDHYLYKDFKVRFDSCEIVDPKKHAIYLMRGLFAFHNCTFLNPLPFVCPEEGEFIGYKKCTRYYVPEIILSTTECIVKLLIPADAKRSSALGNKCRCSKARVIGIFDIDGNRLDCDTAYSIRIPAIRYEVGKEVYPDSFDDNRFKECSHGIHFFMTFDEAKEYQYW